ncbi:MAG: glucose 1-dehydrogenase [Pseudomonadota bacterium]
MTDLNKTAIVTGSSQGIGKGIVKRLASDGYQVVVNYHSDSTEAEKVVASIKKAGGQAIAVQADVTIDEHREKLLDQTIESFGSVNALVHNSGISTRGPLQDVSEADWDRLYALNAKAPFFLTQSTLKHMNEGGAIIFVSSSTASFPMKDTSLYASSKMPVRAMGEVLAKELGPKGIRVNTVIPGPTAPGMFADAPEHLQDMAAGTSPFDRIGHPEDIAGVVSFLVSDNAKWVTGQNILVNGGATM